MDFLTIHNINNSAMNSLKKELDGCANKSITRYFLTRFGRMGGSTYHLLCHSQVREDGSDRYLESKVQHKYSKCPAWMSHGTIYQGRKGPAVFWGKSWGSIDSAKYNQDILPGIQPLVEAHPELTFMQDNAPSHRSRLTARKLARRAPYSADF